MKKERTSTRLSNLLVIVSGGISAALGLIVLVGWYTYNVTLVQVVPTFVPMQYNTALGFLLCGAGLLSIGYGWPRLAMACGGMATAVGLLTLIQYIFGVDLGIDQLLMKHYITVETSYPGRMAPNTALSFALTGIALLVMGTPVRLRRRPLILGLLGSIIIALGLVASFGYLSGITTAYGWGQLTHMAVHTAAGFAVLGVGVTAFAWRDGRAEEPGASRWLPALVGVGVATASLLLWQALDAQERAQSPLSDATLVGGLLMALLLAWAVHLAQTARVRTKEVETTETKFSGLLESAPDAIMIANAKGQIMLVNRQTEEMFGYHRDELLGKPVETLIPERYRKAHVGHRASYYSNPRTRHMDAGPDLYGRRKDGSEFPVEISLSPMESGGEVLVISIIHDITERKQTEKRLRLQSSALESVASAIVIADREGRITWTNPAFTNLTGYTAEEAIGQNPRILKSGKQDPSFYQNLWETLLSGQVWHDELVNRRKDGTLYTEEMTITPVRDEHGEISHFIAVKQDVTERRQAEQMLRESEERYRTLFENATVGLGIADTEGNLLTYNEAVLKPGGYTREDIARIGNVANLYYDPNERAEALAATRKHGFLHQQNVRFKRKDGGYYDALLSLIPITIEGQRCWQAMVEDVTERKQRERELETIATMSAALRIASTRAEMLPVILDQSMDLLNADGAALVMRDPVSGETVVELGHGAWATWTDVRLSPGEGVSGHVIATGQPYLNNNGQADPRFDLPDLLGGLHAMACVPLIAQEQTIGALWVGCNTDITDEGLRLLAAIADIAANAIDRATLHEKTKERLQRLIAMRNIDMAISDSLDVHLTLNVLVDQVTGQLGVDAAAVLLLSPHTHTLEYAAGRGFRTAALQHTRLRLGEGHAGRAALERRLIGIPNLSESGEAFVRTGLADEDFIAYHGVPLIAKGQVKGVLEVFHREPLDPDPEWLDFLDTLARQAAIAIDNAELFDDLQRSNVELALAYDTTLGGWARALELRDMETEGHSRRVTELTLRLAKAMGVSDDELVHIRRGALLHDIGKMGIPDAILLKPGSLDDDEWEIMRQHPVFAYELLSPIAFLRPALEIPYCHHEKWDGTGYPRGLKGEQIPLAARIFAVADVYDALLSDRPYRPAWPEEKVCEYIREQAGKHFDPQVVEVFLEMEEIFVENGTVAEPNAIIPLGRSMTGPVLKQVLSREESRGILATLEGDR